MIEAFVDSFMNRKSEIEAVFVDEHPERYMDVVKAVISALAEDNSIDANSIHEIDDGDYQGTLLYVIPEDCYQPDEYYYVKVSYGSCTGCDTLESIRCYGHDKPSESQVKQYMTLALHIVQGLKKMGGESVYA